MFKKFLTIACILAVLCGCKKEEAPKVSKVVKKVECFRGGNQTYSYSYSYDSEGRLNTIKNSNNNNIVTEFKYAPESITILSKGEGFIIDLDGSGAPKTIVSSERRMTCFYSSYGYLKQMNVDFYDGIVHDLHTTVVNGNFTEIQDLDGRTLTLEYTSYDNGYSIDINNIVNIESMFSFLGTLKLEGLYSGKLVKSIVSEEASYYFSYSFDAKERVTDMTVISTASENSLTEHYKFTY